MPGLAPSVKNQSRTTGVNMTVKMGRLSTTLSEVDCKSCNITDANSEQDKTGSMGQGWGDSEQGNDRWNISMELINHTDDPLELSGDKVWYVEKTVAGRTIQKAYFLMNSIVYDTEAGGDDKVTMSGISVNRKEGAVWFRPTETTWVAP